MPRVKIVLTAPPENRSAHLDRACRFFVHLDERLRRTSAGGDWLTEGGMGERKDGEAGKRRVWCRFFGHLEEIAPRWPLIEEMAAEHGLEDRLTLFRRTKTGRWRRVEPLRTE